MKHVIFHMFFNTFWNFLTLEREVQIKMKLKHHSSLLIIKISIWNHVLKYISECECAVCKQCYLSCCLSGVLLNKKQKNWRPVSSLYISFLTWTRRCFGLGPLLRYPIICSWRSLRERNTPANQWTVTQRWVAVAWQHDVMGVLLVLY